MIISVNAVELLQFESVWNIANVLNVRCILILTVFFCYLQNVRSGGPKAMIEVTQPWKVCNAKFWSSKEVKSIKELQTHQI